jgi:hypothetical protein
MPSGYRSGKWYYRNTCGDPACTSMLLYVPHERSWSHGKDRVSHRVLGEIEIDYDDMREYDAELDRSDILERDFKAFVDERGADIPETVRSFPWSSLSMLSIAVLSPAGQPGEVCLSLAAPAGRSFVERYCGGDEQRIAGFEVVYAWRCDCPEQTLFIVERPGDFPAEPGYYGACPRCGSVALRVEGA